MTRTKAKGKKTLRGTISISREGYANLSALAESEGVARAALVEEWIRRRLAVVPKLREVQSTKEGA